MYLIYLLVLLQLTSHIQAMSSTDCLTNLLLYVETSDQNPNAISSDDFEFDFSYDNAETATYHGKTKQQGFYLGDNTTTGSNHYAPNKGNFYTFGGLKDCSNASFAANTRYSIKPAEGSTDGWLVRDAILYGQVGNDQDFILIAHNYGLNEWIDYFEKHYTAIAPLSTASRLDCTNHKCNGQLIKNFYIMSMTSNAHASGGSDVTHKFKVNDRVFVLYNRVGDDMVLGKGDLWKVSSKDAGFPNGIAFEEVNAVSFEATNSNDWLIKDAFVTVELQSGGFTLLAGNTNINKWLGTGGIPLKIQRPC